MVASKTSGTAVKAKAKAAEPALPDESLPADAANGTMRLKDLVDRVTAASGAKKKDVKQISTAVLQVLGDALQSGEALQLPPFGKAKVSRHKDTGSGEMLVIRLKRGAEKAGKAKAEEPLAEPAE